MEQACRQVYGLQPGWWQVFYWCVFHIVSFPLSPDIYTTYMYILGINFLYIIIQARICTFPYTGVIQEGINFFSWVRQLWGNSLLMGNQIYLQKIQRMTINFRLSRRSFQWLLQRLLRLRIRRWRFCLLRSSIRMLRNVIFFDFAIMYRFGWREAVASRCHTSDTLR